MTVEKVIYTEETITSMPNGTFVHEHIQHLRDDVDRLETDRDEMLLLLYDVADANDLEDLEEVLVRVKAFTESRIYPTPY